MGEPGSERVLLIMPAWNEEAALPDVLDEVRSVLPDMDVLVVNDCSTDATSQIAHAAGVAVLDLPINLGVGGAMRAGYRFARAHGYDLAVQLDADGQHDPAEVPRLLEPLRAGTADIVIGARFTGRGDYHVRGPRRWAMRLLARSMTSITHTQITDATSGFRANSPRAVALFAIDYPAEYLGDTVESLVIAARAGLVVRQVGVEMRPRLAGVASHNPAKAAVFLVRAFAALLVALTRPRVTAPEGVIR